MKQLAMIPAGDRLPELRDAVALDVPLARARMVKDDVQKVRWLGYAGCKSHGLLVPAGPLESPTGTVKTVCGKTLNILRPLGDGQRCKSCVSLLADDERKRGTGLSESQTDVVDTGSQDGDPRDAELRRVAELGPLSGEAAKDNAQIVDDLRAGDRGAAVEGARVLDARARETSVSGLVPEARSGKAPVGCRDHGMLDGVAMVQGANMAPVQRTWRNPATKVREPAAARLDGSLNERPDREVSTVPMHGGTYGYLTLAQYEGLSKSQQRKYWYKVARMRDHGQRVRAEHRAKGAARMAPTGTGGLGGRSFVEDAGSAVTERLMQQAKS